MTSPDLNLQLPYLTADLPGIGGRLRATPQDFKVREIPLYEPSGSGDHYYLRVTRKGHTTRDVVRILATAFKVRPEQIGYAGLKDKNALTTQNFSVERPRNRPSPSADEPSELSVTQVLLDEGTFDSCEGLGFHGNKLKTGHLKGNQFEILISGIKEGDASALTSVEAIATVLRQRGIPNYLGAQRFGGQGDNHVKGWEILTGKRRERDKWLRRFLVTAYQSYLCNLYLARRVEHDLFDQILLGDVAKKHDTGGIFIADNLEYDQQRFKSQEISFTAPLFGAKMTRAQGQPGAMEAAIEQEGGITDAQWRAAHTEGTRRMGRILLHDLEYTLEDRGVAMRFSLPKGAFATTVLREFMKVESPAESADQGLIEEMDDEAE